MCWQLMENTLCRTITTVQTRTDNGAGTFVLSKSLHPKLNFHFYGTSRWLKIKEPGKGVGSLSHKEVFHCVSWLSEFTQGGLDPLETPALSGDCLYPRGFISRIGCGRIIHCKSVMLAGMACISLVYYIGSSISASTQAKYMFRVLMGKLSLYYHYPIISVTSTL